jgi:hypothetical protein
MSPVGQLLLYVQGVGGWHTIACALAPTHLCPEGQSDDARQATWQTPEVHTNEPPQSLFRMHAPPTSIFLTPPQPAASNSETMKKPRTRDTDISILQIWCHQAIATRRGF